MKRTNLIDSPGLFERNHQLVLGLVSGQVQTPEQIAAVVVKTTAAGIPVRTVGKYSEGHGSIVEEILAGGVDLVINTPHGRGPRADGYEIRAAAVRRNIPYVTTMEAVRATLAGIGALRRGALTVRSLQEYLAQTGGSPATNPPKESSR